MSETDAEKSQASENKETGDADLEQELDTLYRKVAGPDQGGDISYPEQPLNTETKAPDEGEVSDTTGKRSLRGKERHIKPSFKILSGLIFSVIVLVLIATFLWPTMYHYDAFNFDGKVYPLRINRFTGETAYSDGTGWIQPPFSAMLKEPVPVNRDDRSATVTPPEVTKTNVERVDSPVAATPSKIQSETRYAIQIKAFSEKEKTDALAFAGAVKKKRPDVQMETVSIRERGVWHRILLGNFSSHGDASKYMRDTKIRDTYPGSFIQMKSGG
ncbi:MAG: SPOR domain-containing protein [Deltaproteobacteria bacterium]|nr:SPOR domain-containing protein [Deltaproteobacteria bacterium]